MEEEAEGVGGAGRGGVAGGQAADGQAVEHGDDGGGVLFGVGDAQGGEDGGGQAVVGLDGACGGFAERGGAGGVDVEFQVGCLFGAVGYGEDGLFDFVGGRCGGCSGEGLHVGGYAGYLVVHEGLQGFA